MNCCIVDLRLYYVLYTEFEGVVGGSLGVVWYGILEFNVPLDTVQVISETTLGVT